MAINCIPSALVSLSTCYDCGLTHKQQLEIQTYLLAQLATQLASLTASSITPTALIAAAECLDCSLTEKQMLAAQDYALSFLLTSMPTTPVLSFVSSTSSSVTVSWTQPVNTPPDSIGSYILWWGTSAGSLTNMVTLSGATTSYTLTGLNASTTYYFAVQAISTAGCLSLISNSVSGTTSAASTLDPHVTDWANRVVANGGAMPSNATLTAVNTWYLGMVADGLDTLMIWLTFFAPDSLTAARTPFFKTAGLDPATNNNFVAGDLTVNGLLGNAINKSLSYGINPSVSLSATNVGWSVYAPVTGSGGFTHGMSTPVVAAVSFAGAAQDDLVGTADSFIGKTNGLTSVTVAPAGNGFYSASRTAINAHIFYFVNSTNPLSIIGSDGTNAGTGLPNSSNAMIFAQWDLQTSAVSDWSDDGYSIFAVHQALTMSQVQKFFTRCDTLRRAFGGGFV